MGTGVWAVEAPGEAVGVMGTRWGTGRAPSAPDPTRRPHLHPRIQGCVSSGAVGILVSRGGGRRVAPVEDVAQGLLRGEGER